MLLGLGSGMGLIYWHQKGTIPFLGGRDHFKDYHEFLAQRTGVVIRKKVTTSAAKAERMLIDMLERQAPVMMCVDMGFLPYFEFDFSGFHPPSQDDIYGAIRQTLDRMLNPPIRNIGVKGIRKAAAEIKKWQSKLSETEFRFSILNLYIFVIVGGTGGGIFRYMYADFLKEASVITGNRALQEVAQMVKNCGDLWEQAVAPCADALEVARPEELIADIPEKLLQIASQEAAAFGQLQNAIN